MDTLDPREPMGFGASSSGFAAPPTLSVHAPLSTMGPPALTKGSGSFMECEGIDVRSISPDPFAARVYTPQPPDVQAQRRQTFGRPSTGTASDTLSGAPTMPGALRGFGAELVGVEHEFAPRFAPMPFRDLDSPAVPSKDWSERRVPSCPQKQSGSNPRKSTPPYPADSPSDPVIQPRALSGALEQTDAVDDLVEHGAFASRLALSTPPGVAPTGTPTADSGSSAPGSSSSALGELVSGQQRSSSLAFALAEAERHAKRQKPLLSQPIFGRQSSCSSTDEEAMPPPAPPARMAPARVGSGDGPPGLHRGNSMADTKVLFSTSIARLDKRHGSFASAPVGTRDFVFEHKYRWGPLLGRGSFADVYVVYHLTSNTRKAVKMSNKAFRSRGERAKYVHEVELASELGNHSNIVEYYTAWQQDQQFYMLMELCEGGTLRDHLNREGPALRLPQHERLVWDIVLHISRGLTHMHSMTIIHCDLKPDNILISSDGAFKIGDLGLATTVDKWRDGMEGDAVYLSRDLLEGSPSVFVDIFSLGLMLYEIVSGERLPTCNEPEEAARWGELRAPKSAEEPSTPLVPPPHTCSPHLQRLISRAMSPSPDTRPMAQEFVNATVEWQQYVAMTASAAAPRRRI